MNFAILPKFANPSCFFVYDWLTLWRPAAFGDFRKKNT